MKFIRQCVGLLLGLLLFVTAVGYASIDSFSFGKLLSDMATPSAWNVFVYGTATPRLYPLLDMTIERYPYMLTLLGSAFIATLLLALLGAFVYGLASSRSRKVMRSVVAFGEAVPNVMLIVLLQLLFIYIFQQTGWLAFELYSIGDVKPFVVPVMALTIVPAVHFFRLAITLIDEEEGKTYIEMAKAKGFSRAYILVVHIARNLLVRLLQYNRMIYLYLVSSLFMIEYMFNIEGYLRLGVYAHAGGAAPLFIWLIVLVVPFYVLHEATLSLSYRWQGGEARG